MAGSCILLILAPVVDSLLVSMGKGSSAQSKGT